MRFEELQKLTREERIELAKAKVEWNLRQSKRACEKSLLEFVRQAWHVVEPAQEFVEGWVLSAIAMHLESVESGEINRLLVNVPPGFSKSLMTSVFFPAWVWGPRGKPAERFLCTAHNQNLALRDSLKMRRLITSEWYQTRWGDRVKLTGDQSAKSKYENTNTGFREAVAFESMTGSRGSVVILDDPHSVDSALSDVQRESTVQTFLESLPTRLNNPATSAIIVIMQRLHQEDVSGIILEKNLGYTHLCLPMEFDPTRRCVTEIGFEDPRQEEGELLFPERFPQFVVERDKQILGPYGYAGQFQQSPAPRGGGIWKREWFQLWDDETAQAQGVVDASKYPPMDYVIASLDPAYSSKEENDPSGLVILGVFQRGGSTARRLLSRDGTITEVLDDRDTLPAVMLMYAWEKRLDIHGPEFVRENGESEFEFKTRQKRSWGLVEHVIDACNRYGVDKLLIESKASGLSVAQEIKRLNKTANWDVQLINPGNADKISRAYAVQPIFSGGYVFAPDKDWADKLIAQCEAFPKAKHDDMLDALSQGLKFLRERQLLARPDEISADIRQLAMHRPQAGVLYDV